MTFILRIFDFRIISESLNLGTSTHAVYKAYSNSLLARTLFSQGNEFANNLAKIKFSRTLLDLQYLK